MWSSQKKKSADTLLKAVKRLQDNVIDDFKRNGNLDVSEELIDLDLLSGMR